MALVSDNLVISSKMDSESIFDYPSILMTIVSDNLIIYSKIHSESIFVKYITGSQPVQILTSICTEQYN